MADGAVQVSPSRPDPVIWAGLGAAAVVAALVTGTIAAVALRGGGVTALGPADWSAVRFTLGQAAVSATLSCALAVPVARALARRSFAGRGLLITLLGAPFLLPSLVAVMGLIALFGRAGVVSDLLAALGLPRLSIYGLGGVLLGHVFFNLPLATRMILQGWLAIPSERFRLAASLGFQPADTARYLERPMLRRVLPGAWLSIFLICLTSFAVALTLGGGPRATTVELAIYQAFRMEFDLSRAAGLALVQFALCLAAAGLAARMVLPPAFGTGLDRVLTRWDVPRDWRRWTDAALIAAAALFLIAPLVAVLIGGAQAVAALPITVWQAAGRSIAVALASTLVMTLLALPMVEAAARLPRGRWVETAGMLTITASPLVIGTGLFLILRPLVQPAALALPATVAVNALMALPFALRILLPEARALDAGYGRLAESLGLRGWARLRILTLRRLRRPLGFACGVTAALSMGDLGVVALLADERTETLPLMLYRLMGAYRSDAAAGAAVLLLGLSFALFALFDRGTRRA